MLSQSITRRSNTKSQHCSSVFSLMPATHAQETCARNLCKQIVLYVQETCVGQSCKVVSCTIFLHAIANSSISRQKLSSTSLECCNMTGGPVVIDLSLVFGSFSAYNYVFSFHKDLKAEWNSDEIGFLTDFIQKKAFVYDSSEAAAMSTTFYLCKKL